MEEYQRRVIVEYSDLVVKETKLEAFLTGEASKGIDDYSRQLLREQLDAMDDYHCVLKKRIASFGIAITDELLDLATTHCPARAVHLIRELSERNDDETYRTAVKEIVANVR